MGIHKYEKRGTDYYWFSVTHDQYEFPISGVYDNLTDYAEAVGKTEAQIRQAVSHAEKRNRWSLHRRVRKDEL